MLHLLRAICSIWSVAFKNVVLQVHKLIPHGHTVPVTNENKKFYLDQLVQFKLVSSTKAEVDEFRRGVFSFTSVYLIWVMEKIIILRFHAISVGIFVVRAWCFVSILLEPKLKQLFKSCFLQNFAWTLCKTLCLLQLYSGTFLSSIEGFDFSYNSLNPSNKQFL